MSRSPLKRSRQESCNQSPSYVDIATVRSVLFNQINSNNSAESLGRDTSSEEKKIRGILDACFLQKVSGSVLVIGPEGGGKRSMVRRVVNSYRTPEEEDVRIAEIKGLACTSDQDALVSLAKQLGMTTSSDNFNVSVEAIQAHFKQSRFKSFPTILLIEDIDEFTRASRQVLLYTLLDLLHRNDFYYVVIGLTHRADITLLLEKRVKSRLNAQCVYLKQSNASDIREGMLNKLQLPVPSEDSSGYDEAYRDKFNATVIMLLGSTDTSGDETIYSLIRRAVAWGRSSRFFMLVASMAVSRLSDTSPFLTKSLLEDCFDQMQVPSTVLSTLQNLPLIGVYVIIAVLRLLLRASDRKSPATSSSSGTAHGRIKGLKGRRAVRGCNVEQVINEVERITGLIKRKILVKRNIVETIISLAEDTSLLTLSNGKAFNSSRLNVHNKCSPVMETTQITITATLMEFEVAFRSTELRLPDRLRRAVLEPMDPVSVPMASTSEIDSTGALVL